MNIICQSLYYQYILDKFHFFKSPKTFRVILTIILCCPCYMPKYVPKLEGIMHDPEFDKDLSVSIPPYLLSDMTIFRLRLYNNAALSYTVCEGGGAFYSHLID